MFKRKSKSRGRGSRTSKRGAGGADSYSVDGGSSIDASLPRSCLKRSAVPSAAAAARTPPALLNVRFREVQVREFERIIGDNPSCSSGAPIGYVVVVVSYLAVCPGLIVFALWSFFSVLFGPVFVLINKLNSYRITNLFTEIALQAWLETYGC